MCENEYGYCSWYTRYYDNNVFDVPQNVIRSGIGRNGYGKRLTQESKYLRSNKSRQMLKIAIKRGIEL